MIIVAIYDNRESEELGYGNEFAFENLDDASKLIELSVNQKKIVHIFECKYKV